MFLANYCFFITFIWFREHSFVICWRKETVDVLYFIYPSKKSWLSGNGYRDRVCYLVLTVCLFIFAEKKNTTVDRFLCFTCVLLLLHSCSSTWKNRVSVLAWENEHVGCLGETQELKPHGDVLSHIYRVWMWSRHKLSVLWYLEGEANMVWWMMYARYDSSCCFMWYSRSC